jgi:cobyrinic acid a,c-diamide synthase
MSGRIALPALMIAAGWRSAGKTTLSVGIGAALARRGMSVQPFKKGPDFIDPQWLTAATGRACRNLDLRLQGAEGARTYWRRHAAGADLALVEGSQSLHDGLEMDGSDSSAALAKLLGLPVVLVLDAHGMGRGAAALALGLAAFDREVRIAGVVLNRVGGSRHEARLRSAIETHAGLAVLGAIPVDPRMAIVERHLGLVPVNEGGDASAAVGSLADVVSAHVDLDRILAAARGATPLPEAQSAAPVRCASHGPRIGIARDRAFGFYYPDDLDALRDAGATLVPFDTLADARLPAVDALFLGGGFPEVFAADLEANRRLRADIRAAIESGLPVRAECGGLMFLSRSLTYLGRTREMVGAIPADVVMHAKPVGKGYVTLAETADHPWGRGAGTTLEAHEFHYSTLANVDPGLRYAWRVVRGHGVDGERDGIVHRNVLASYAHMRSVAGNDWAARFVAHVLRVMSTGTGVRAAA